LGESVLIALLVPLIVSLGRGRLGLDTARLPVCALRCVILLSR